MNAVCSVSACQLRAIARGWCNAHYQRWLRHGDPTAIPMSQRGALERFAAKYKVDPTSGCWLWTGCVLKSGYARFRLDGVPRQAHQVSYELHVGPIPEGLELDHTCHTSDSSCAGGASCLHRRCVNPAHLEPVTTRENTLRGMSPASLHAQQTHCIHGHPFDEENTYIYPQNGARSCRTCKRERDRASYANSEREQAA